MRRTPSILVLSLLATSLVTSPVAALPAAPLVQDAGSGHAWDPDAVGGQWDGGTAEHGGTVYGWPEETYSYGGAVCPAMDELVQDTQGDPATVTLTADEGELISAYCLKAGSAKKGEGPKLVVLDEPVAELVVAYPTDGKCKEISHYAVAYVDQEPASSPAPKAVTDLGKPATDDAEKTPARAVSDERAGKADEAAATPMAAPARQVGEVDVVAPIDVEPRDADAAPDLTPEPTPEPTREAVPVASALASTGADAATLVAAALVLVAAGATTLVVLRRRTV